MKTDFLLLADGRTPTGGHAHSGGLEAAITAGLVGCAADLERWLVGRLETVGRIDSAFACAWWALASDGESGSPVWCELVGKYWARTPAAAQRSASRARARGVLRAGRAMWGARAESAGAGGAAGECAARAESGDRAASGDRAESAGAGISPLAAAVAVPGGAPWPLAMAAVAVAAGVTMDELAVLVASASVTGPAWAATRLLALDPFAVARCLADLSPRVDAVGAAATRFGCPGVDPATLPATSALLLDIGAVRHAVSEVTLFAS